MDEQVLNVLRETLSPVEVTRRNAEEQLKQLSYHPEGSLSLARILQNQQVDLFQRQSAGVLLQHYINNHWSVISNTFEDPVTSHGAKAQIRPLIFSGLSDPERKIRLASAFALSTIAKYDWPEDYPDLLSSLVQLLHTPSGTASAHANNNANAVHGAMRVITEFVKNDLSEEQLLPVVRDLLPALLNVLGDAQSHSYTTRAECITTFRQTMKMLDTVREEHPAAVKKALEELSPTWFGAMQHLLSVDARGEVEGNWEALGLRIEIFRTLTMLQSRFPKLLLPSLPSWFTLTLHTLSSLTPLYSTYYLSTAPDAPEPPSPTSDAGFMPPKSNLDDMACAAFDFMIPTSRVKEVRGLLVSGGDAVGKGKGKGKEGEGEGEATEVLQEVMRVVLEYTKITRANEEEWLEDANAFVMDEDEEAEQYSVRTVGLDVVGAIMDKYPRIVARLLHALAQSVPQEASQLRAHNVSDWWKGLEAALALLGGLADDIRDVMDEEEGIEPGGKSIELAWVFESVIPGLLDQSDTPFLQGRAFVFASQFAGLLPEQLASQYLGAAVNALESSNVGVPVKISAVKTIKNFCRFVNASVLRPSSHRILSLLVPLLGQATGETLYLVLETIRAVLGLDDALLTPDTCGEVVEPLYSIWETNSSDPIATAIIEETFDTLASRPTIVSRIVSILAPRLAGAIAGDSAVRGADEDDNVHVPGEAVQLANSLIRTRGGPIEEELVQNITAAVMGTLAKTDDMDVIQHGMIHLTLLIRKDAERLINWTSADGTPGLTALFHLLARFLDPQFSESGGLFVGDLIMHLFRKAGHAMGGVLPDLLRAVVTRLASAKMPMFIQSLVLPFAYLFSTEHTTSTIDLLAQIPVTLSATGEDKTGLELVLASWCETSETVSGSWNIRVTDLGMLKLFTLADPRVSATTVKGDLIVDEQNRDRIMTRSRTRNAPDRYTQVPFPLKALKLLLKDVHGMQGGKKGGRGGLEGVEEDDGDEEWDDDDDDFGGSDVGEFDYLSSWLDAGGPDNDTQDDDEDLKSDPIAQIDLPAHLTETIRQCYASNVSNIQEMVAGLTDTEKGIMKGLLTL